MDRVQDLSSFEMGDPLATIDMGRGLCGRRQINFESGSCCALFLGEGAGSPSNNVPWAETYLHTK